MATIGNTGTWMPVQEIPMELQIIGLKCDTESNLFGLQHIGFLLGTRGVQEQRVVSEIRFPKIDSFPTYYEWRDRYD